MSGAMINVAFQMWRTPESASMSAPRRLIDDGSGPGKNCTDRSLADRGRKIVWRGVVMSAGEQQEASAVVCLLAKLSLGEGRGTHCRAAIRK